MSVKNDFKAFSISNNSNALSQYYYESRSELQDGFDPLKQFDLHVLNKALRQSSVISSVVADFIATESGNDVLDDGDVLKLTGQLNTALKQKIATGMPIASLTQKGIVQLTNVGGNSDTLAVTQKLFQDTVNVLSNNTNNKVPNTRKVNGKELIADINLSAADVGAYNKAEVDYYINAKFANIRANTANSVANGWWKCGDTGIIIQWGQANGCGNMNDYRYFTIPFPNACFQIVATYASFDNYGSGVAAVPISASQFIVTCRDAAYQLAGNYVRYFAIGY
ncbi:hypothetical protein Ppb6_02006 [Photorhabdus australis subsp. thailandensis]|uniref:Putative tail fiber protein gp53-like C-terminal domain-containing protein n=1 Tax=Photorhabdus australis subsp. thailandensis TaxID=2805096 RepID=A0A1C0U451_9GAMM|nr:tail fiber protein [Photorhabdus australis]OCQ52663.1 hypothetical protein Ppb6_02006 [Photorhabdus australis subsp. thailandensis]